MRESSIMYKWKNTSKVLLAVSFLVCGCLIYLLFRSKTLNIYQWSLALGISTPIEHARGLVHGWVVSDFIRFSLPDGLYCAAYILLIDTIWRNDKRILKYYFLSVVPIMTISSELLQYYGLVRGTFDIADLLCYLVPPMVYFGNLIINNFLYNNLKTEEL